ncbi:hypothetical protein AAFF_G00085900 [Aldrovandia affinis]|uniref:Methyltransferase domain-containing protein n=1 Tax=Aldrovandia affinis TaxID=143900 RepID=A0AAD7RX79_9TELE|nr:hypothetical protein AAFF_G00085900 [Aldrovandia affinis]
MDSNEVPHGCQDTTQNDEEQDFEDDLTYSKLGTKDYWDDAYQRELRTYRDMGDVGEIWFGEESMERVSRYLRKENIPANAAILDIGMGNGVLLVELAKCAFTNLTGIDYSAAAVELARSVLAREGLSNVKVEVMDFLSPAAELTGFDVCVDKGTFDAVSLNPDSSTDGKAHYLNTLRARCGTEASMSSLPATGPKSSSYTCSARGLSSTKSCPHPASSSEARRATA